MKNPPPAVGGDGHSSLEGKAPDYRMVTSANGRPREDTVIEMMARRS
jgi:hypothetical protein